jgi:hypothetical protein
MVKHSPDFTICAPSSCTATYQDPIDNFSAIYSVLPLGENASSLVELATPS